MGCKDSGEISIAKCSSTPGTDTPPPPRPVLLLPLPPISLRPTHCIQTLWFPHFWPSVLKKIQIQSMISVLLFSCIVKGVEIGNSDSPGSLHRNFTRWNN